MYPVTLKGERVELREFAVEDAPIWWSHRNDPLVARYQTWPQMHSYDEYEATNANRMADAESDNRGEYALAVTADGQLVGQAGLTLGKSKDADASLFVNLASSVWGKGIGTESARLVVRFGFDVLNLHRIWARVCPDNIASKSILESKLGMRYEGRLRECVLSTTGEWFDMDLYGLLVTDKRP